MLSLTTRGEDGNWRRFELTQMLFAQIKPGVENSTAVPFQGGFIICQGGKLNTYTLSDFTKL